MAIYLIGFQGFSLVASLEDEYDFPRRIKLIFVDNPYPFE